MRNQVVSEWSPEYSLVVVQNGKAGGCGPMSRVPGWSSREGVEAKDLRAKKITYSNFREIQRSRFTPDAGHVTRCERVDVLAEC